MHKTFTYLNPNGTTQQAKAFREGDYVIGDGDVKRRYWNEGSPKLREDLMDDSRWHLNQSRFLIAALEIFDEEVKEAQNERERERDKELANVLYRAWAGRPVPDSYDLKYDSVWMGVWMEAAKAAREHIESEKAETSDTADAENFAEYWVGHK